MALMCLCNVFYYKNKIKCVYATKMRVKLVYSYEINFLNSSGISDKYE